MKPRPPLATPEFATREELHRLLLKASQLEGERQVPAKLREMLILWGRRIEEILHDRPVEDPIRWADVTAELGPDAWELANPERCGPDVERDEEDELSSEAVGLSSEASRLPSGPRGIVR